MKLKILIVFNLLFGVCTSENNSDVEIKDDYCREFLDKFLNEEVFDSLYAEEVPPFDLSLLYCAQDSNSECPQNTANHDNMDVYNQREAYLSNLINPTLESFSHLNINNDISSSLKLDERSKTIKRSTNQQVKLNEFVNHFIVPYTQRVSLKDINENCKIRIDNNIYYKMSIYFAIIKRAVGVMNKIIDFYGINSINKIAVKYLYDIDCITDLNNKIEKTIDELNKKIPQYHIMLGFNLYTLDDTFDHLVEEFTDLVEKRRNNIGNPMYHITMLLKKAFITATKGELIVLLLKEIKNNKKELNELKSALLVTFYDYLEDYLIQGYYDRKDLFLLKLIFLIKIANKTTDNNYLRMMNELIEKCVNTHLWIYNSTSTKNILKKINSHLKDLPEEKKSEIPITPNDFYFLASVFKNKNIIITHFITPMCNNVYDFEEYKGTENSIFCLQIKSMKFLQMLGDLLVEKTTLIRN
ncbi:hypothetical protein NGRA_0553 [Nosema granulosis]|uniref:Uncharacterized protein n=1 Tax=Nosema granulosis TaxID=83296 RepID=A0A9P6H156_9MICR|nr:hypothetical protein NGRA_0553 [Nosema granulosis]